MPDAALNETVSNVINSAFGSAGQRCLAGSVVVTVGEGHDRVRDAIVDAAGSLTVGNGADDGVELGPVISHTAKERILGCIERGVDEGAALLLDGRGAAAEQNENGAFVGATIFDQVQPDMALFTDEIFGPVLSMLHVDTLDDAITLIENQRYGNAASIFTQDGAAAREFRYRAPTPATSASTWAWPRLWPTSPSAARKSPSSAPSTAKAATPSTSSPNGKW